MSLKVPPPLLAVVVGLLIWASTAILPPVHGFPAVRAVLATMFAAFAVGLILPSAVLFRLVGTTVNPTRPDTASDLVVIGLYRFSRNPMYLGMALGLAATGLALGSLATLVLLPGFVWYMNRFQIGPEETALEARFGDDYRAYKQKVRRWL